MKTKIILPASLFLFMIGLCSCEIQSGNHSSLSLYAMTVEYLEQPAGLDIKIPRFSWKLEAVNPNQYGQRQTAYRIVVSDSDNRKREGNIWDTGWVKSNNTQLISYEGKNLLSDRTYYWRVKVKDESGNESSWSPLAKWSTGLLERTDWSAKWIGGTEILNPDIDPDCNISDPWLRKIIKLDKKPAQAVMFIASIGYHELYVNGEKIGKEVLAPVVSDHTTRARYIGYDIAGHLKKGENIIALWLGTSWSIYEPYKTDDKPHTPLVLAQADIYFKSPQGEPATPDLRLITDDSWKLHPSPNKLLGKWAMGRMGGELWDDNKNIIDWNLLSYDDSHWENTTCYNPNLILSAQNTYGNMKYDEINPISIQEQPDGSFRVDMGINFAGWTQIKVKGNPGDRIDFLYSEREDMEMTFRNYSAYIIGASGEGIFRHRFNYNSGRWITIKGMEEKPSLSDIKGWMIRTAYQPVATFECSDDLQNWIYNRIMWTFENLSIGGYIVDCPQRERLGYGGDAHATSETGLFNYQLGSFYTKWMQDWRDVQGWESCKGPRVGGGVLPHTAPTNDGGGGPSWGGICITLPWFIYQHEGDIRILEENFEMMDKWLDFLESHTSDNLLRKFGGMWDFLGDWLWPNATAQGMNNYKPETECFNNCYFAFNLATAAKIATVLNKKEYAEKWNQWADEIRKAVHQKYYIPEDQSYADRSMGNLAAALIGEIPPPDLRKEVFKRLEKEIMEICNGHINVGITGGALLFKLLRDSGRDDLIYSMTSQTDYPGWGYMKENRATTIWEMWEKDLPGHSLLHSSYLYPGAWYIDGIVGIRRDPANPGFKRFYIRAPKLTAEDMVWAKGTLDSPTGKIISSWKKEDGLLTHEIIVPPNTIAIVCIPEKENTHINEKSGYAKFISSEDGYQQYEVPAGKYTFIQQEK